MKTNQSARPLNQQPFDHFGVIVGRVPGIVVKARKFGETGEYVLTSVAN